MNPVGNPVLLDALQASLQRQMQERSAQQQSDAHRHAADVGAAVALAGQGAQAAGDINNLNAHKEMLRAQLDNAAAERAAQDQTSILHGLNQGKWEMEKQRLANEGALTRERTRNEAATALEGTKFGHQAQMERDVKNPLAVQLQQQKDAEAYKRKLLDQNRNVSVTNVPSPGRKYEGLIKVEEQQIKYKQDMLMQLLKQQGVTDVKRATMLGSQRARLDAINEAKAAGHPDVAQLLTDINGHHTNIKKYQTLNAAELSALNGAAGVPTPMPEEEEEEDPSVPRKPGPWAP